MLPSRSQTFDLTSDNEDNNCQEMMNFNLGQPYHYKSMILVDDNQISTNDIKE